MVHTGICFVQELDEPLVYGGDRAASHGLQLGSHNADPFLNVLGYLSSRLLGNDLCDITIGSRSEE